MTIRKSLVALVIGCSAAMTVNAASIYLTPASRFVLPGTSAVTFDLTMNFSAAESTIGGGIDIDVSGAGSFSSFAPSTYFTTVPDSAFTGHGTLHADNDYEIHLGSFGGLSGLNNLGTLTLMVTGVPGTTAAIALAENRFFGGFFSATSASPLSVTMTGGTVGVVPEPRSALLLLAGLGAIGFASRRRLQAG